MNPPNNDMELPPPQLVFLVPYRDREQQRLFFSRQMTHILEDYPPGYTKIYFIHQRDNRSFNRGAIKNIGFLAMKQKYPQHYQNMTFVFNDVDTMPYTKNFLHYETSPGRVKHFYGFQFALGGIVSICGRDFEKVNGFPNFWTWGYEDNLFQVRVLHAGFIIDRSEFYPLMDKNILQMKDGLERTVNKNEFDRYLGKTTEGLSTLSDLSFFFSFDEINHDEFVHVTYFNTGVQEDRTKTWKHDLRKGAHPFGKNHVFREPSLVTTKTPTGKWSMRFL
jgi:hypothetical protein